MSVRKAFVASLTFLAVLSVVVAAQAQDGPDNFGVDDGIDLWIPAAAFNGRIPWANWDSAIYEGTANGSIFLAPVSLPQGALLDSWRAFFVDTDPDYDITVKLFKVYDDTTATPTLQTVNYGTFTSTGTPGYTNHHQIEGLTVDLREPAPGTTVTRAQAADFYEFEVDMPPTYNVRFKGMRVIWHRQVSPSPAVATFDDVPISDPAFQYVEALAASGVTAGCNVAPPMYCPDATLTRRQMAVFLAKALGLHWPNR